ncbi:hypothetical protein [Candidatus Enterovibrio escicola]|uniref:Mobile element protein n=1 Tax=Candidatus Enterovibrio escicola TaxID=1927127 RepID=A0A2A5SZV1_9GAMM|nr:hypothetical protein [Candidatus Enterovibrio escacola]PCS21444.1 hypothetical protein BTN49_2983 [Candidatus Enterovibrio escacola]
MNNLDALFTDINDDYFFLLSGFRDFKMYHTQFIYRHITCEFPDLVSGTRMRSCVQ